MILDLPPSWGMEGDENTPHQSLIKKRRLNGREPQFVGRDSPDYNQARVNAREEDLNDEQRYYDHTSSAYSMSPHR